MYGQTQRGFSGALRLVFCLVLGAGAFLILYRLGLPSLWLDEAASPLNARYPVAYILELSRSLEEHPPLYYLLLKAVMGLGQSDALLRLPSALCGLGCLVMAALVGRGLFGWPAGILAAALWLAMPQNLWLSRIARPYALWLFLFSCSVFFLERFLRLGKGRDLWLLLGVNAVMTATHYLTFPVMAAQGACLVLCLPTGAPARRWRAAGLYAAGAACIAATAYIFLIRHSSTSQDILGYADAPAAILPTLGQAVAGALYYFEEPLPRLVWLLAVAAGFLLLWRHNRPAFRFLLTLAAIPLAAIFVLGKSTGLYSRHVSFLALPACLALAGGAASAARLAPRLGLVTVLVLAVAVADPLLLHRKDFYALHSYQVPVIGNNYKETADALAAMAGPGTAVSYSNDFFGNAVAWYLAQKPHPNPVDDQRLTPDDKTARLIYAASTHHGYLAWTDAEFRWKFGPDVGVRRLDATTFYTLTVPRQPVHAFTALPASFAFTAAYPGFFATAAALDGLRHHQNARSPAVVATRNDHEATARFVYENRAPAAPQDVLVNILYDNVGRDNRLAARVTFDDEPATTYPLSTGYDAVHQRPLRLRREAPYARLAVEVTLRCASLTPTLEGGDLETLRLREVQTFLCPAADGAACRKQAEQALEASLLDNFRDERFLGGSSVPQHVVPGTDSGVVEVDGEGQAGWTRLVPREPDKAGSLRLEVRTDAPRLVFFPRLGHHSSIRVWADTDDGGRELLFGLRNDSEHWTPVSAQYELVVPPRLRGRPVTMTFELLGPWAQLWRRGDSLFF